MGSQSKSSSDPFPDDDVTMLVSEVTLGAAIKKHVMPAMEEILASRLQATLEATIASQMQSILSTMKSQQELILKHDALQSKAPPCDISSRHVLPPVLPHEKNLTRVPKRSHSVPGGISLEKVTKVQSVCKEPHQRTAACIDRLTMENVIRNAGLLDGEASSSKHTSPSDIDASGRCQDYHGQSAINASTNCRKQSYDRQLSSLSQVVPSTFEMQDSEEIPNINNTSGNDRSESPASKRVQLSTSYTFDSEQGSNMFRSAHSSKEDRFQQSKHELNSETNSDVCLKATPSASFVLAHEMKTWDGVFTLNSISRGKNQYSFRLYLLYACFGITPWSSSKFARWYKIGIRWASACVAAFCIVDLILHPKKLYELVAQVALSISSYLSLALLGHLECILGGSTSFLGQHAIKHKFLVGWRKHGMKRAVLLMLVWMLKVGASIVKLHFSGEITSMYSLSRCFVAILGAGLHLAIIHSIGHALTFLQYMLDAYSDEFYDSDKWAHAVTEWNVVQAILHNLSSRVDCSFLAVETSAAVVFLSYAAGVLHSVVTKSGNELLNQSILLLLELPTLIIALSAFVLFVKAAGVTETCVRVPPVMNSVKVEEGNRAINYDRQYVVTYIAHSQAGFRAKGSLIDATMLMNYCYICGAIVCGLCTTGLSMLRQQNSR